MWEDGCGENYIVTFALEMDQWIISRQRGRIGEAVCGVQAIAMSSHSLGEWFL